MKNIKKYYLVIIGIFLLSTMVNPFLELKVNAASNDGLTDALNTAPQGIDLSNGRFKMPETAEDGNPYVNPVSSKVVAATDGSSNSNRIVQVIDGTEQVGGIWGDPSRNNYISTDKKQKVSLWINMSRLSKFADIGDGLAFVLQNDDRKTNAMATTKDKSRINNGDTLGVWGYDNYGTDDPVTGAKDVASDAIQNSWALEIDTLADDNDRATMPDDGSTVISGGSIPIIGTPLPLDEKTTDQNDLAGLAYNALFNGESPANSFDLGRIGPHIATGFPGDPATYSAHKVKWFSVSTVSNNKITQLKNPKYAYYYSQNHIMPTGGIDESVFSSLFDTNTGSAVSLAKGWHHLTITIDFPNKKISYAFNDKKTDGTISKQNTVTGETDLTDADVNGTGRFGKIKDNRLMYGFTGSTGPTAMNGLAIFEQIPGFAETDVTTDFKDISSGKDLTSTSDFAYSGEQLKLNYNLTYTDGNEAWTGVKSHIILPKNINYTPDSDGNIGTVSVGGTSAKIAKDDITTDSSGNNILVCGLPGNGTMNTGETSTATYSINGIAGDVTADTTVASTHSRFIGDNGISDVDSPAFAIKQPDIKLTSTTENPLTINKGQGATINGLVTNSTGSAVTNSDMTVHLIVNGETLDSFQMSNSDPVGQLTAKIAKDYLTSDTNTVQIYVTNGSKTSNSIMFTIKTKDGGLSLNSYPKSAKFKTVNTTKKNQIISRSGDWDLSVLDSRGDNNGAGNTWRLMAKSNQLHIGDSNFNGSIIFKTGNNYSSLTNEEVPIATGETISKDPVTTDIDSTWTDNSGVLLKSNGQNPSGTYNGSIEWTLYDSI